MGTRRCSPTAGQEWKQICAATVSSQRSADLQFQPRRLAVLAPKKLIAMTDDLSEQYYRHVFVCDFHGQAYHKVYKIEDAKRLSGIHADDSRIFACDKVGCSVYIVDYNSACEYRRRIDCSGSPRCPCQLGRSGCWSCERRHPVLLSGYHAAGAHYQAAGQNYRTLPPSRRKLPRQHEDLVELFDANTSKLQTIEAAESADGAPCEVDLRAMCVAQSD
ncbi:hypothetical protein BOX15_Mlig007195g4, partial [Macrostomum lignano]